MPAEVAFDCERCTIWRIEAGSFPSNSYVFAWDDTCVIVDPGLDHAPIAALLQGQGLTPVAVMCTHGHFDHVGSAAIFQNAFGVPVYLHQDDQKTLRSANFLMMAFRIPIRIDLPEVTLLGGADAAISIGGRCFKFSAAPGHTPGSCVIEVENAAFTGDTLYAESLVLSRLPGENVDALRTTLAGLWNTLPENRLVLPGHGPAASFSSVKKRNCELRSFLGHPSSTDDAQHA